MLFVFTLLLPSGRKWALRRNWDDTESYERWSWEKQLYSKITRSVKKVIHYGGTYCSCCRSVIHSARSKGFWNSHWDCRTMPHYCKFLGLSSLLSWGRRIRIDTRFRGRMSHQRQSQPSFRPYKYNSLVAPLKIDAERSLLGGFNRTSNCTDLVLVLEWPVYWIDLLNLHHLCKFPYFQTTGRYCK